MVITPLLIGIFFVMMGVVGIVEFRDAVIPTLFISAGVILLSLCVVNINEIRIASNSEVDTDSCQTILYNDVEGEFCPNE